jgi:heme A synthase
VTNLRRLALIADVVALAVVLLGSWTRINAAGLTCPDWPMCRHSLIPAMSGGTLWEWTHRLLAFTLLPLIAALGVSVWRARERSPFLVPLGALIVALFLTQVGLGAATVDLDNTPFSVVLHWGTAMALIASLLALAIFAEEGEPLLRNTRLGYALALTTVVAFVTMCIGAYVSSSGAGLACLSLPGCAGNVVVYTSGQLVQMLHRVAAGLTLLLATVSFSLVWIDRASQRVRLAASAGAALVFVQVLLGLLNVALRLPSDLRELHAGNAALVFLAFVAATAFSLLDANRAIIPAATEGSETP